MTIGKIKELTRSNLFDAGVTFWAAEDLDDSVQDGYDDVAFQTQCIVKRLNGFPWLDKVGYINFKTRYNVNNYMGTTAIFNNNTNMWLRDDVVVRHFDQLRRDWEVWCGQPQFWAPVSNEYIVVVPRMPQATGSFDLIYWEAAPVILDDTHVPLIATDMQGLLELYSTADMLEQAQEYVKASKWWDQYQSGITEYSKRTKNLARKDQLLTI